MSSYRVVREYPQSPDKVWRALDRPRAHPAVDVRRPRRRPGWIRARARDALPLRGQTHPAVLGRDRPCESSRSSAPPIRSTERRPGRNAVGRHLHRGANGDRQSPDVGSHRLHRPARAGCVEAARARDVEAMLDDQVDGLPAVLKRLDGGAPRRWRRRRTGACRGSGGDGGESNSPSRTLRLGPATSVSDDFRQPVGRPSAGSRSAHLRVPRSGLTPDYVASSGLHLR